MTTDEYMRKSSEVASATDVAQRAEEAAMIFYPEVATMFVYGAAAREDVEAALKANGQKAFLPPQMKLIEPAAQTPRQRCRRPQVAVRWLIVWRPDS